MNKKHSFIKGALILGASGIISRFLGLFFRWPVTMLIGDEGIGLYQLSYPLYMFIIGIMSGFPIAISKMVSESIALGKQKESHKIFKCSLIVMSVLGFALSGVLFLGAPYIIKLLKWRADSYYSLSAVAAAPFFIAVMNCFRGYFQGLQFMWPSALSQIVEQLGRIIVGVGLTYMLMTYGISYSAAGAASGAFAGAVAGCILLVYEYLRYRHYNWYGKNEEKSDSMINIAKVLLTTAIPISLGMTVGSVMSLIDSVVVPERLLAAGFGQKLATELYGQLTGKAHVLINVPLTLAAALGTSLVPAISEVRARRNMESIGTRGESAVKLSMLIGLPSAAGLFVLADPILKLIFPGISEGAATLQVLSFSVVFIVISQVFTGILNGVGNVMSPVKNLTIGAVTKFMLSYVLTGMPLLNIKGAAIATIVGYATAAILNLIDVSAAGYFKFDIDKMLLRPLICTLAMGAAVYILYNRFMAFTDSNGISTIISILAGMIVYLVTIIITGCLSIKELRYYMKITKQKS